MDKFDYTFIKKINMTIYFENLTIKLHVLYVFNIYVKFSYKLDVTYNSIHKLIYLFILHKFRLQKLEI